MTGRLRPRLPAFAHGPGARGRLMGLVALAHTLPPSTLSEVRIECHMFVFRVNLDLQIVYCESRCVPGPHPAPMGLGPSGGMRWDHGP